MGDPKRIEAFMRERLEYQMDHADDKDCYVYFIGEDQDGRPAGLNRVRFILDFATGEYAMEQARYFVRPMYRGAGYRKQCLGQVLSIIA